jgi:hypothetical protein
MKIRRIAAAAFALIVLGAFAGPALADGNNPANTGATSGYEGQPGNQAAHH